MGDLGHRPFFVVGAQRSGTTMLRLMLNAHSRLCVPFESVFIPEFYHKLNAFGDLACNKKIVRLLDEIEQHPWVQKAGLIPDRDEVLRRQPDSYSALIDAIFSVLSMNNGKVRWGDKTPGYVVDLDVIRTLFPDCQIIHLVRDGRDVALSLKGISWGSRNLLQSAADWRWKTTLGRKMGRMMGDQQYREVRYEDLVVDPEGTLREVCEFLGEFYEPGMLDYPETAGDALPQNSLRWHASSVASPDISRVSAWREKMDLSDQIVFEEVAGDALKMFGYEVLARPATLGSRVRHARYALLGRA